MKRLFFVLAITAIVSACNSGSTDSDKITTPSTVDSTTVQKPLDTTAVTPLDTTAVKPLVDTANGKGH
jgi:hypothetical protein